MLVDGWNYANWVVGTVNARDVDPSWPAEGARLYHNSGSRPLLLSDVTVIGQAEPPRLLVTRPRLRPLGRGTVTVRLTPVGNGQTRVSMKETFHAGVLRIVRTKANDLLLHRRNVDALRRLSDLPLTGKRASAAA